MIVIKCFFLILFCLLTLIAYGEDTEQNNSKALPEPQEHNAKQALIKMLHAMQILNYQGTVAFLKNGKLEPMRYFHAAKKGVEQERLLSLNSPLREVVRDTDKVFCLFKATQQLVVDQRPFEHSFLINMPDNLDELNASYRIEFVGEENIAMLPAVVFAIKPKDKLRYPRKIWLDKTRFLPLKVVVYDLADDILEQFVFTDLEVKNELPFINVRTQSSENWASAVNTATPYPSDQASFVMSTLPLGFKEIFFTRGPIHHSGQPVEHLLLSDGLASVSIYMEHKNSDLQSANDAPDSVQSIGAINLISKTLGDFELTVLGEIPGETVKFIADSIKLRHPAN